MSSTFLYAFQASGYNPSASHFSLQSSKSCKNSNILQFPLGFFSTPFSASTSYSRARNSSKVISCPRKSALTTATSFHTGRFIDWKVFLACSTLMTPALSPSRSLKRVNKCCNSELPKMLVSRFSYISIQYSILSIVGMEEEFEKEILRERDNKLAELMGLEQRRMNQYKGAMMKVRKEKERTEAERDVNKKRFQDLKVEVEEQKERHKVELQGCRDTIRRLEVESKAFGTQFSQKKEEILRSSAEKEQLRQQITRLQEQIRVTKQESQDREASLINEIGERKLTAELESKKHEQSRREGERIHKQKVKEAERAIKLELDGRLKEIDQQRHSQESEREVRVRVLENQNLRLVEEMAGKNSLINSLKQKNLELQEDIGSQHLKSKLKLKEKEFEVDTLKKQLAFEKEQIKSETSKHTTLIEERQETRLHLEDLKRRHKDELRQTKELMEKKVKDYIGYNEHLVKDLQEELKEAKKQRIEAVESTRALELNSQKNILKAQADNSSIREEYSKDLKEASKRENQLKLQLESRNNDVRRLEEEMEKQKMKILSAMKVFDDLLKSKGEIEKENKLMISEIKYWRDKYKEIEKGRERDKERPNKPDIPTSHERVPKEVAKVPQHKPQLKPSPETAPIHVPKSLPHADAPTPSEPRLTHIPSDKSQQLNESDQLLDVLQSYKQLQNSKRKNRPKQGESSLHNKVKVEESAYSFPRSSEFQSLYRFIDS